MVGLHKNFVFIHITKTGGLSIRRVLRKYGEVCLACGLWKTKPSHSMYKEYADVVDMKKNYVFAVVRNPWDRLVSLYAYWRQKTDAHPHNKGIDKMTRELSFADWVKHISEISEREKDSNYRHVQNQCLWLEDRKGEIHINKIIRFEQIVKGFAEVCADMNIGKIKLPHSNRSKHKNYKTYYDGATRDLVHEMYGQDINEFGYEFG